MGLFSGAKPWLSRVKNYEPGKPLEELEREYGIRDAVKMASNENALGPSPKALKAATKALFSVHRYPEGGCYVLRQRLAKHLSVSPESLVFGNGSDEILVFAIRAFVGSDDEIVIADPTFLIYEIACQAENGRAVKVPMKNFRYDLDGMFGRITGRTKIIFIANPDNPIGTAIAKGALEAFLKKVPSNVVVVLDEAYYEFAKSQKDYPDSLSFLRTYKNLLVTRTFSKAYGLSGLRVGYGIASPEIVAALNKVREPFNVNSVAQAAAYAALGDTAHLLKTQRLVSSGRKYLQNELAKLKIRTVETVTNFVLADLGRDAGEVYEGLLRRGVIVRPMGVWGLKTFIRVTIGKPEENKRFIKALKEIT